MSFDFKDIVSFKEYCEIESISSNTLWRRINQSKTRPVVLSEFEINNIKYLRTNRYDKELARAIRDDDKVKLISLKLNQMNAFRKTKLKRKVIDYDDD